MPATQDAYARAFAANAAKKAGTPAGGGVSTQQPVVTSGMPPRDPTQGMNVAPVSPGVSAITQALMRQNVPGRPRYMSGAADMSGAGSATDANGNRIDPNSSFYRPISSAQLMAASAAHGGNMGGGDWTAELARLSAGSPNISPNQNMQGPNAQPTLGDLGGDIFGIKAKQAAALAAMQPPAPPPAAPVAPPQPPGNWARQFFGSGMGSPSYGPGNAMAKLNGWAQQNPQGVQRWADAGHVPVPTMMPQQRRTGAAGR